MKHLMSFFESNFDTQSICVELKGSEYFYLVKGELIFSDREYQKLMSKNLTSVNLVKACPNCLGFDCPDCSGYETKYQVVTTKIDDGYYLIWFIRRGEKDLYFKIDGFNNLIDYLQVIKYFIEDLEEMIPEDFPDEFVIKITS